MVSPGRLSCFASFAAAASSSIVVDASRGEAISRSTVSSYYQLLTGHALTAPFLKDKLKKTDSDQCWWCETGKRQTRDHLFKECERWKTEINVLWTTIGKKLGWKHRRNKKISELFREEKATGAILQFLRDTGIGKIKIVTTMWGRWRVRGNGGEGGNT